MTESIFNMITANEVFEENINKYIVIKTEETKNKINDENYKGTYCDASGKCFGDKFFIDISGGVINSNISANKIYGFPKINNINIDDLIKLMNVSSVDIYLNKNYIYPSEKSKYVYYDLSNNDIKDIIKLTNGTTPSSFYTGSPYIFTQNNIAQE